MMKASKAGAKKEELFSDNICLALKEELKAIE